MKVGILTFPGSPSHGAALQMYALYKRIVDMGHDAEIINYSTSNVIHSRRKQSNTLKHSIIKMLIKSSAPSFEKFEKKLNKFPKNPILEADDIYKYADRYDRIIVGSDQVWNPAVTGNDMNYYLKFSKDYNKNASYAPSFGINVICEKDRNEITGLLENIKYLSAREKQGADIIKNLINKDVPVVIDPSMLISKNEWKKIEDEPKCKEKYFLYYTIKPSPTLETRAQLMAEENGCILLKIGGRLREKYQFDKHPLFGVGPSEFLGLVHNAQCVVTNSFHGTVFSIIYNKNFLVEYSSDTNSRLINLIDQFGLQECIVQNKNSRMILPNINYMRVNKVLNEKIKESEKYLRSILES